MIQAIPEPNYTQSNISKNQRVQARALDQWLHPLHRTRLFGSTDQDRELAIQLDKAQNDQFLAVGSSAAMLYLTAKTSQ